MLGKDEEDWRQVWDAQRDKATVYFFTNQPKKIKDTFRYMQELSEKSKNPLLIAETNEDLGLTSGWMGQIDICLSALEKARELYLKQKENDQAARALLNIGYWQCWAQDYIQGLESIEESVEELIKEGEIRESVYGLIRLTEINSVIGNFEEEFRHSARIVELLKKFGSHDPWEHWLCNKYTRLALACFDCDDVDEALEHCQTAEQDSAKAGEQDMELLRVIAVIKSFQNDTDTSLEIISEAKKIAEKQATSGEMLRYAWNKGEWSITRILKTEGNIFEQKGKIEQPINSLQEARNYLQKVEARVGKHYFIQYWANDPVFLGLYYDLHRLLCQRGSDSEANKILLEGKISAHFDKFSEWVQNQGGKTWNLSKP